MQLVAEGPAATVRLEILLHAQPSARNCDDISFSYAGQSEQLTLAPV